jgi:broad specificity phosphatase PhoE
MAFVYLVRHGQASFLADDYDQLSAVGATQAALLGALWREHGPRFDAVWTGTLRRHEQTLASLSEHCPGLPQAQQTSALNEYDAEALLAALGPDAKRPPKDSTEGYRAYFQHLRKALGLWMDGAIEPLGLGSFAAFRQQLVDWLTAQRDGTDRHVLVVSSGGPISTLVGHVLGAAPATMVDLNFQMRNTAVTTLLAARSRCQLLSFNNLPHLLSSERRDLLTSA